VFTPNDVLDPSTSGGQQPKSAEQACRRDSLWVRERCRLAMGKSTRRGHGRDARVSESGRLGHHKSEG
jgi:hypothetical protein